MNSRGTFGVMALVLTSTLFPSYSKADVRYGFYYARTAVAIETPMIMKENILSTPVADSGKAKFMIYSAISGEFSIGLVVNAPAASDAFEASMNGSANQILKVAPDVGRQIQKTSTRFSMKPGLNTLVLQGRSANVQLVGIAPFLLDGATPNPPQPPVPPEPTPKPTPIVSQPTPPPGVGSRVLAAGELISFGGMTWGVQTPNVIYDITNNALRFKASTGEFANFDPTDGRKIRNEVAAMTRFEANKLFTADLDLFVKAPAIPHKDLQWFIPVQIHQADVRLADGTNPPGSPMFALDVQPNKAGTGYDLHVQGESSTSMTGGFVQQRLFASVPFDLSRQHHIKLEVIDTHGKPGGMIRVTLDGEMIVSEVNIPTGWSYVDTDVLLGGKRQENRSYLKLGIYAGNQYRPAPVTLETIVSNFSWSLK